MSTFKQTSKINIISLLKVTGALAAVVLQSWQPVFASAGAAPYQTNTAYTRAQVTMSVKVPQYVLSRQSLIEQIQRLGRLGVPSRPFYDRIVIADRIYAHGESQIALFELAQIGRDVVSNGRRMNQKAAIAPVVRSGHRLNGLDMNDPGRSVAQFSGSEKELIKTVLTTLVAREFGQDAPKGGPFLLDRLRIARRIQELECSGIEVSIYRSFYRQKVEPLVTDNRRLRELRDNTQYLQQQLGLPLLQAANPTAL